MTDAVCTARVQIFKSPHSGFSESSRPRFVPVKCGIGLDLKPLLVPTPDAANQIEIDT